MYPISKLRNAKYYANHYFFKIQILIMTLNKKCLNVGCGHDVRIGWTNCDVSPINNKVVRFDISLHDDLLNLANQRWDIIECCHVIGYMNYICVLNFFKAAYDALNEGGILILEFPDLIKLSKKVLDIQPNQNVNDYIEVIRAIYAFDLSDAFDDKFSKKTYIFGWSAPLVTKALNEAGFLSVTLKDPKTHGKLIWRDSRIEAIKT